MVGDGLEHLSKQTKKRAVVLARNAKSLGIPLGAVRFTPHHDFMSYYFSNSTNYIIIFCSPDGYLAELWSDSKGIGIESSFFAIKNIRHFLQTIRKLGYQDIDDMLDIETDPENEDNI